MLFSKLKILRCLAFAQLGAASVIGHNIELAARQLVARDTAFRDNYGSNMCLQVSCDTMVCAGTPEEALAVASSELNLIMGPDCAGWENGAPAEVPAGTNGKTCPAGLKLYQGNLMIWRAWNNVTKNKHYKAEFVEWENFKGAMCTGKQDVTCQKYGLTTRYAPDPDTGLCVPYAVKPPISSWEKEKSP